MKYIKLIVLVVLFGAFTSIEAQTSFGYINSNELLSAMPQMKEADKELETYAKQLENDLRRRFEEAQREADALQQAVAAGTITQQEQNTRAQKLEATRQELLQAEQEMQMEMMKKRETLLQPILTRAQDAIKQVADERGIAYVFDISIGSVIHYPAGDDISAYVKAKLGI